MSHFRKSATHSAREESSTPDLFMAPKSPRCNTPKIVARLAETSRSERARCREDERDADEDDDADETEEEEEEIDEIEPQLLDGVERAARRFELMVSKVKV